jgi:hypothetical protein
MVYSARSSKAEALTPASLPVAMHAHSKWSYDADWSLARIGRMFGRIGARAVMMTEHDTGFDAHRFADYVAECREASTPACRIIPGIEYSSPDNDIHILTWGLDRFLGEGRETLHTLRDVAEAGGVAVFAHPKRREVWRRFSADWVPYLAGIEVWNRKTDGLAPCREALSLVVETGLPAIVGVDFHRRQQIWPLLNRFRIGSADDLEGALVQALRAGAVEPRAFGMPVLRGDQTFAASVGVHSAIERARRGLKQILQGSQRGQ